MSDTNPAVPATPTTPDKAPELVGEIPTNSLEEFLEDHGKKTAFIILAAVLVFGLFYFFKSKAEAARVKAAEAFVSAATIDDLKAVADKYAGTVSGGNALLMLADRQLDQLDKPKEAKATLEKFVANHSSDPLYQNGVFALGCVEQRLGNTDAALGHFQKVAEAGAVPSAAATLRAGDLLLEKGEFEKAKSTYEGLAPKFPSSPFIAASGERIAIADRKIVLRDNPAPPPEPEPEPEPVEATPGTQGNTPGSIPGITPTLEPTLTPDSTPAPAPIEPAGETSETPEVGTETGTILEAVEEAAEEAVSEIPGSE